MKNGDPIRVAVVDDDKDFLWLVKYQLERDSKTRFAVTCFPKPMMVFEPRNLERFDAYVVDFNLIGANGLDLIRTLRGKIHPGPYILCSGFLTREIREQAEKEKIDAVVEKTHEVHATLAGTILAAIQGWKNRA